MRNSQSLWLKASETFFVQTARIALRQIFRGHEKTWGSNHNGVYINLIARMLPLKQKPDYDISQASWRASDSSNRTHFTWRQPFTENTFAPQRWHRPQSPIFWIAWSYSNRDPCCGSTDGNPIAPSPPYRSLLPGSRLQAIHGLSISGSALSVTFFESAVRILRCRFRSQDHQSRQSIAHLHKR